MFIFKASNQIVLKIYGIATNVHKKQALLASVPCTPDLSEEGLPPPQSYPLFWTIVPDQGSVAAKALILM